MTQHTNIPSKMTQYPFVNPSREIPMTPQTNIPMDAQDFAERIFDELKLAVDDNSIESPYKVLLNNRERIINSVVRQFERHAPKGQTNIPTADELWEKFSPSNIPMKYRAFTNAITELSKAYDQRIADLEAKIAELEGTVGSNEYRPWDVEGITQIAWWKKLHLEDSVRIADLEQQVVESKQAHEHTAHLLLGCGQRVSGLEKQLTVSNERMKQLVGELKGLTVVELDYDRIPIVEHAEIQAIIAEFEQITKEEHNGKS